MDASKTFDDLQWGRLVAAIRARASAPRAEEREIALCKSAEGARTALSETGEALSFLASSEPLPLGGIEDVRPSLSRVAREGSLDGPALRDLESTLRAATALQRFLGRHRGRAPALHAACAIDPTLDRLADEIGATIEADGTVSDHASPELRRLRTEVHNLRARLVSRLEEMIHKNAAILSDRFYTIRDGRYVLPLRTDAHESFPGIVHGTSGSGATLFVEPRAVVSQGNRLKVAEAEMEREVARLLSLLTDLVRERLAECVAALDALEHADLRNAMAVLGRDLGGIIVEVSDTPEVHLVAVRHPLLLLDGVEVVPADLDLGVGSGLIISGPNAGGKTVALKVLGLTALMVRAGIPVPAAEGSTMGFFDPVLTDVGDEQSIEKNLSTFSAHVSNLAQILDHSAPGAMVLLDELAGGTDPAEGAALACAVVEAIVRRGGMLAATTHYEQLKAFAATEPRLHNASVGFDVERLLPTFELVADLPGASSALSVASRFGIGAGVVARARELVPEHSRGFEALAAELGAAKSKFEAQTAELRSERAALAEDRAKLERERAAISARDQKQLSKGAAELREELRGARDEVRAARKRLKKKNLDQEALADAKRRIEDAAAESAPARDVVAKMTSTNAPKGAPIPASDVVVGARVYVPRLKADAEVLEAPRKGQVKIAAGAIRLTVSLDDLRVARGKDGAKRASPSGTKKGAPKPTPSAPALRSTDNTLDVRGLRVDEALGMTDTFVDRLYGASQPYAFIVHGHGTGALRDALRVHLSRDETYVRSIRSGTREEGGDGITVVTLR